MPTSNRLPKRHTARFPSTISALLRSPLRRSRIKAGQACAACLLLLAPAALFLAPSAAQAQITVTILNPAGSTGATAAAISGTQEAGAVTTSTGANDAAIWSGTAGSFVNLGPSNSSVDDSYLTATSGTQQVGHVIVTVTVGQNTSFTPYAALWSGTAASYVNLNPTNSTLSDLTATTGSQQAGYATFGGESHAGIWSGTAGSFSDLNPAGANSSTAYGTNGTQQVGSANFGTGNVAGLWSGTAASFVSLAPVNSDDSNAVAISGTQEVGYATFYGGDEQAALWSGTAGSYVNLDPISLTGHSEALATDGTQQVGFAFIGGASEAALWSGTAASYFNLQTSLGSGFQSSSATGIDDNGTTTYVTGTAYTTTGQQDAVLWQIPDSSLTAVPEPTTALFGLALTGVCLAGRRRRRQG